MPELILVADPSAWKPLLVVVPDEVTLAPSILSDPVQQLVTQAGPQLIFSGNDGPPGQPVKVAAVFNFAGVTQAFEDPLPYQALLAGILSATLSSAKVKILPTATTVFTLKLEGTVVGTCTFSPGNSLNPLAYFGVWNFGSTPVPYSAFAYFELLPPTIPDVTLSGATFIVRSSV